jgi:UDP-glucose 4-epimerase
VGDTAPKRDFTFVTDTALAFLDIGIAKGITHGEAYNGGTGRAVTIGETVEMISRLSGCNKPIVSEEARLRPADSEVRALLADNSKLHKATGWVPATKFEDGLAKSIDWWRVQLTGSGGFVRGESNYML